MVLIAGNFRALAGRFHELVHVGRQEGNVFARPVFQNKSKSTRRPNSLNGWRWERERDGAGQARELLVQLRFDRFVAALRVCCVRSNLSR